MTSTIKNTQKMFRYKKNSIKRLTSGFGVKTEKYLSASHNIGSRQAKYLSGKGSYNYKIPYIVNEATQLARTKGKKNFLMRSAK